MKNTIQLIVGYACMIVGALVLINTIMTHSQYSTAVSLKEKVEKSRENNSYDWGDEDSLRHASEKFGKHQAANEVVLPGLQTGFVLLALGALLVKKD